MSQEQQLLVLKKLKLAKALLKFKQSYEQLVDASTQLPDYDISKGYPFYLLDFEAIKSAVSSWCIIHYDNLISQVPVVAPSPAETSIEATDMTIEQMKDYLKHSYTGNKWAEHVEQMPDDQIIAIYKRLTSLPKPVKINKPLKQHKYYAYMCNICGKTWTTDIEEQTECRKCGSDDISQIGSSYIAKESEDED